MNPQLLIITLVAIVLIVARLVIFIHLHVRRPQLSILRNTVSDYGTGCTRREFTVMGALTMPAYLAIIVTSVVVGHPPAWAAMVGSLGALAGIAMLLFPTDLTGTRSTATGRVHWLLAIAQFTGLFLFIVNLDGLVVMTWIVRISFYAFLASLVLPKLRRTVLGLTERLFLVATPVWFLVLAGSLLITSGVH